MLFSHSASAQVTYLNTFVAGAGTVGGDLPYPVVVAAGSAGQVLVSDPISSVSKAYAADGSYQFSLVPNAATGFGPAHTTYNTIGGDGRYYLSNQTIPSLYTFDASGAGVAQINLSGTSSRVGFAIAPTGTLFVAANTAAAPSAGGVSVYSASNVFLTRFGDDRLDRASLSGLALSPDASRIYVADHNSIFQFTSSGGYVNSFGDASGPGQLSGPKSVAVSQAGLVYVADVNAGIKVFSAEGDYMRTVSATVNNADFVPSTVAVGPTGFLYAAGSVAGISNPIAARFFDPSAWIYGTNAFTNPNTGPTSVTVGFAGLFGQNLTLRAPIGQPLMGLTVGDTLTVANGNLTIAGGGVTTATLALDASTGPANFTLTAGTLNAAHIVVSNGGVASISQPVAVVASTLRVSDATSGLSVDQSAALTVELLTNKGQIYVGTGASLIAYAPGMDEDGSGTFNLNGGTLDLRYAASLAPAGVIQGSGTLVSAPGFTNSGTIKLAGPSAIRGTLTNQTSGKVEISGLQPTIFFDPVINNGTFTVKPGAAAVFEVGYTGNTTAAAALNVAGLAQFSGVASVAALNIAGTSTSPTGTLDLSDHGLIVSASVNGTPTSAAASLVNVRNLIISGFHSSTKDAPGIISSAARTDSRLQVGYARAADLFAGQGGTFLGQRVNASDILLRTTLAGDSNLDGVVDFADLVAVAQNYGVKVSSQTESWWTHGDFNYDGVVDFSDLVRVAQNYGAELPAAAVPDADVAFEADVARAFASVPEPSTFVLVAVAACSIGRRRMGGCKPPTSGTCHC